MITPDDARQIVASTQMDVIEKSAVWLGCWERVIRKAASEGKTSARESDIDRPRTPIPEAAKALAREKLKAAGFVVRSVAEGPNESTYEVAWA